MSTTSTLSEDTRQGSEDLWPLAGCGAAQGQAMMAKRKPLTITVTVANTYKSMNTWSSRTSTASGFGPA